MLGLRKELAAAEAAERLEAQLAAGRAQLAAVAVVGLDADPQPAPWPGSSVPRKPPSAPVGSALGFTLVSVATACNPPPPSAPGHAPGQANTARRRNAARSLVG